MFLCCTILPHCCSLTDTHTGHEAWEQTELTPQWCREFTEFGVDSSAPDCAAHILVNIVDRDLSFFHCAAQGLGLGGKRQCRLLFAGHVKRFDYYSLNFVKLVVAEISVSLHLCNNTISKEAFYDYMTNDVLTFTHTQMLSHQSTYLDDDPYEEDREDDNEHSSTDDHRDQDQVTLGLPSAHRPWTWCWSAF